MLRVAVIQQCEVHLLPQLCLHSSNRTYNWDHLLYVSLVLPTPSATLRSTGRHKDTGKHLHMLRPWTRAWKGRVPNDAACSNLYAANSQALVATVLPSSTCRTQALYRHLNLFPLREASQHKLTTWTARYQCSAA